MAIELLRTTGSSPAANILFEDVSAASAQVLGTTVTRAADFSGVLGGERFTRALDYVGLDFFPDVFRPMAGQPGELVSGVTAVMETMRTVWLPNAGIPDSVPMHVTEHGWPTGAHRTEARQAEVIEGVIVCLHGLAESLNIERYMHFALRDAQHEQPGLQQSLFHFFGLTRADYRRKPAFETYRRLIEECGARQLRPDFTGLKAQAPSSAAGPNAAIPPQ